MEPRISNVAYILDVRCFESDFDALLSTFDEEVQNDIVRFLKMNDRLLALGKHLLLREYTSSNPLKKKENGKPYKEGDTHFSISHSFPYCVLYLLDAPCGVDIETMDEKRVSFLNDYFGDSEEGDFPPLLRWNIKESCYKALGEGYLQPKCPLTDLDETSVCFMGHKFYYHAFEYQDAYLAFASLSPFDEPRIIDVDGGRFIVR